MKVALFFDGQNFYSGWRDHGGGKSLDFVKLSHWLVKRVGGSFLWGAHYYTGIDPALESGPLDRFLTMLETRPGFFVQRFAKRSRSVTCVHCGTVSTYTEEKEVDTTMVADMLRLAAVGAFDILVLLSGDADHAPAVEGVRLLGKQAYVASWSGFGLAGRLRRVAFDHIDITQGLREFLLEGQPNDESPPTHDQVETSAPSEGSPSAPPPGHEPEPPEIEESLSDETFLLDQLARAEYQFKGGYVGLNHFIMKWLPKIENLDVRRRLLDAVVGKGLAEIYTASDGSKALRRK